MRYRYLLVDNDNTLMDFDAAEGKALREALSAAGVPHNDEVYAVYHDINRSLWEALERGETTQAKLKVERFVRLVAHYGWPGITGEEVANLFQRQLPTHADLLPGAMDFMEKVHGKLKIALVSNGLSATQRGRLSLCPFTPLLDAVIISEEIGVSKPNPRMLDIALDALGCTDRREAVMLGDSLTADIAAANTAGVDSIWLNLHGKAGNSATYEVTTLREAADILLKQS